MKVEFISITILAQEKLVSLTFKKVIFSKLPKKLLEEK
jgi:hypothetical protein